jgi:hypothetical protein
LQAYLAYLIKEVLPGKSNTSFYTQRKKLLTYGDHGQKKEERSQQIHQKFRILATIMQMSVILIAMIRRNHFDQNVFSRR